MKAEHEIPVLRYWGQGGRTHLSLKAVYRISASETWRHSRENYDARTAHAGRE